MHGQKSYREFVMKKYKNQQGISLFIVIVLVLMSMLLALWASRTAFFNELIVGNDTDYQRTFEAAQVMLQDAELDIRQGTEVGTNQRAAVSSTFYPTAHDELDALTYVLDAQTTKCFNGICQFRTGAQDFWNDSTMMSAMIAANIGARYGQYTGASAGTSSNPILADTTAGRGAWYWVEVIKYEPKETGPGVLAGAEPEVVNAKIFYRITAIARGLKPSTQVVLQNIVAFPSISGEAK